MWGSLTERLDDLEILHFEFADDFVISCVCVSGLETTSDLLPKKFIYSFSLQIYLILSRGFGVLGFWGFGQ